VIPPDQHVYVNGNPFVVISSRRIREEGGVTLIKVRWVDDRVVEEIGIQHLETLVRHSAGMGFSRRRDES